MILKPLVKSLTISLAISVASQTSFAGQYSADSQVLFGDTHLHTSYSFDAFLNRNQSADPDTAYRWAKGLPVIHPYHRARVQIKTPLDFLVVADHAELMGGMRAIYTGQAELSDMGWIDSIKRWVAIKVVTNLIDNDNGVSFFRSMLPEAAQNPGADPVQDPNNVMSDGGFGDTTAMETTAWSEIVDAAERHNQPGKFTSFIGWEWSSIPTGANLHRIVITPDGADKAKQYLPYGSDQSQYPEDLWQWLSDTEAATGSRFISIPHNSNISKGYMFADTTLKGEAITAEYAKMRAAREPIVEVTQIKGDSETHPELSPDDSFADFETYPHYIQQTVEDYQPSAADYVRSGLKRGLAIEQKTGVNPYKFGMIGSTDSHTGLASAEETNFLGKTARDSIPENKNGKNGDYWRMAAQGLAAVWAPENNREEIFAAFKRKEVYATTGSRLKVRVFAGWGFTQDDVNAQQFAQIGYAKGVPMGGDLSRSEQAPQLLIRAVKDPIDANLDRVQVIKGWLDQQGQQHERVYNVVWAGERQLDDNGKLETLPTTINPDTLHYSNDQGAAELATLWTDPDFNSDQKAFYYLRVLQIETPRHSSYDAMALQQEPPAQYPESIQERAYTSPIWYTP
jgi:Protein of unknown function (DUF3604)